MLFAIVGWAQESKSETKVSLLPVIVEGNVERVPDGTVILLGVREGKGEVFVDRSKDTIVGGRFRLEYTPKDNEEDYCLFSMQGLHDLKIYASPGTTTTVKGVGVDYENWYVMNDNPMQKEANEYRAYLDDKIPGYYDLRRRSDWIDEDDDEYYAVKKKKKEADSLFVEYMTEFMQGKEYNSVFAKYMLDISVKLLMRPNKVQREKAAKLLAKAPKVESYSRFEDAYIYRARRTLLPKFERIRIGEKLADFVLYDHQDKEHHLTEFNGNGKYLLLEFNSRTCEPCVKHRPNEVLNNLYRKHSDKVDMLMVNNDDQYFWQMECKDPTKYGRDPWHEWSAKDANEDIMERYGSQTGPCYFFVDKDGTILGRISDLENLEEAINRYFKL